MILVFEPTWTGTHHAPGNSATIQTISCACPHQVIRVFAEASHLRELRRDVALNGRPAISFHEIELSKRFRHRPHRVSIRRLLAEFRIMRAALREVPRREPCLIVLISATSTVMVLAGLLLRVSRRRLAVQVGLHGDLNGLRGWRPRNPLKRALDLRSRMQAREPRWLRFLVLEDAIRQELFRIAPQAAERTDVLPLPVNVGEIALVPEPRLELPLQVGFVGQATEAKGISSFLDVARTLKHRYGNAIEFHLIGRAPPGSDLGRFAVLDSPPTSDHLPRQDFLERLGRQHFVFLPFQAGYYNLSASGALLDALTWLKPIIATKLPIVVDLFARHGDIGYLCDDAPAMRATLEGVLATMDTNHYRRQVEALRAARATRLPEAMARQYREILRQGFAGLLTGDASAG